MPRCAVSPIPPPRIRYPEGMQASTTVSVEEYLSASFSPDREYVDGLEPDGALLKVTGSDIVVPVEEIFRQVALR